MSHQLDKGSLTVFLVLTKGLQTLFKHSFHSDCFLWVLRGLAGTQMGDQQPLLRERVLFYFFHYNNNKMKVYLNLKPQFNIELLTHINDPGKE